MQLEAWKIVAENMDTSNGLIDAAAQVALSRFTEITTLKAAHLFDCSKKHELIWMLLLCWQKVMKAKWMNLLLLIRKPYSIQTKQKLANMDTISDVIYV